MSKPRRRKRRKKHTPPMPERLEPMTAPAPAQPISADTIRRRFHQLKQRAADASR